MIIFGQLNIYNNMLISQFLIFILIYIYEIYLIIQNIFYKLNKI